ncbi:MmcQ/YjbR family DNA-binding protein [Streptosporangiaceae bacterium NEAU-GS5]|nr:MmcQ/YjbR family DNA-binding protein [Streptosporangiaceae bacterium NEAU-GS5]
MVTVDDIRRIAMSLPRTEERLVRDRVTFRVGRIVYLAVAPDETTMGFGFPKEERAALVASEPGKFLMPRPSDERYHWVRARLAALDEPELRELVIDAWRMCAPKRVAAAHLAAQAPEARKPPSAPSAVAPGAPDGPFQA